MLVNPKSVKLHAYIAQQGVASRRKAEELISQGKVTVNGQVAVIGQRIDPTKDKISVNGRPLAAGDTQTTKNVYYLVYKPVGYVSTTSDELGRKTVLDLLPKSATRTRLYPVGRLDVESEGLMLLTNDGELTNKLTHPSYNVPKTYQVLVKGIPTPKALDHLRKGVKLVDGFIEADELEVLRHEKGNTWLEITIHSGKNRIVRRMMRRVGYDVIRLIRTRVGDLTLAQLENQKVKQLPSVSRY
ncbi:MAG TPA: pseudouridine synthase [Patescibacteria group bacterium]